MLPLTIRMTSCHTDHYGQNTAKQMIKRVGAGILNWWLIPTPWARTYPEFAESEYCKFVFSPQQICKTLFPRKKKKSINFTFIHVGMDFSAWIGRDSRHSFSKKLISRHSFLEVGQIHSNIRKTMFHVTMHSIYIPSSVRKSDANFSAFNVAPRKLKKVQHCPSDKRHLIFPWVAGIVHWPKRFFFLNFSYYNLVLRPTLVLPWLRGCVYWGN